MSSLIGQQTLVPHLGGQTYSQKVKSIFGSSLLAYWMLNELAGATADNAEGTAARDGTYTGVTLGQTGIGDGRTSPLFDGLADDVNIFTASLASAFNILAGTMAAWAKVSAAGVWTDATARTIVRLDGSSGMGILIRKNNTNNQLFYSHNVNSVNRNVTAACSLTGWFHVATTWDTVTNAVHFYLNGVDVTGVGTPIGAVGTLTGAMIGRSPGSGNYFDGYIAHVAIGNTALTPAQIARLAVV